MNIEPSHLLIRKLEVDLRAGFGRHWNGGDAFMTQFNNALSMSFPVGEQSFIDSVRECAKMLPDLPEHQRLRRDIDQFIGQEATHRHIHSLYNAHLEKQGLVNRWEDWATQQLQQAHSGNVAPMDLLAVTAAFEHLTAMLSEYVFRYDTHLDNAEPMMSTIWRWHAAEETEHRAVAFDLYKALGGTHAGRIRGYLHAMKHFTIDATRQTVLNLWHDGTLFLPSTWWSAAKFLFGLNGVFRRCAGSFTAYFRRDFHPAKDEISEDGLSTMKLAQRWLEQNAASYRVVR